jgi:signal peptidase I
MGELTGAATVAAPESSGVAGDQGADRSGEPAARRLPVRGIAAAVLVLLAVVAVRALVAAPTRIASHSMDPTIAKGQVVLIDKVTWRLTGVDRGDFVEFHGFHQQMLKRVVGVGGDVVEMRDARLFVNGKRVSEPYVDHSRIDGEYFGPITVPDGELFVLGDNRANSIDSRNFGPVPEGEVVGTVRLKLWPLHAG